MPTVETENLLGIPVAAVDLEATTATLAEWLSESRKGYVSLATAHGIQDARASDGAGRAFRAADLVVPDGMALVWLLRMSGRQAAGRVYGPDLMMRLCERSLEPGWSHFFLGGSNQASELLVRRLSERFPGLRVAGTLSPRVGDRPEPENPVVDAINESGAEIVWVGLGSPKQDLWMSAYRDVLRAPVLIGVGAAFDFVAGTKPQAPRWVQRSGFEWLHRWLSEPGRLTSRYAKYPAFVAVAGWELLRKRLGRIGP
ncbi:MAG: WecB/TagA/CpsF family glycosyltransferase [Thermoanaerobaculia bacterium]